MLELKISSNEKPVILKFEHSLLSIAKWEAKYKKAFLGTSVKTNTELVEYFEEMLLPPSPRLLIYNLDPEQLEELTNYINDSQTASSVPNTGVESNPFDKEVVTSELIYYWMVSLQIPFEAERWHINRLMMLVRITNFKNQPVEKQNKQKIAANWREINERRKAQYNTKG